MELTWLELKKYQILPQNRGPIVIAKGSSTVPRGIKDVVMHGLKTI